MLFKGKVDVYQTSYKVIRFQFNLCIMRESGAEVQTLCPNAVTQFWVGLLQNEIKVFLVAFWLPSSGCSLVSYFPELEKKKMMLGSTWLV